jgi:hypothetical protein
MQGTQLRDVYKKLETQIKAGSTYIESGRNVGDSFKDFSSRLNPETQLGIFISFLLLTFYKASCVRNVAELQRDLEVYYHFSVLIRRRMLNQIYKMHVSNYYLNRLETA